MIFVGLGSSGSLGIGPLRNHATSAPNPRTTDSWVHWVEHLLVRTNVYVVLRTLRNSHDLVDAVDVGYSGRLVLLDAVPDCCLKAEGETSSQANHSATPGANSQASRQEQPDVSVDSISTFPVVDRLTEQNLPFAYCSGVSYNIWYNKWSGGDREDHTKYHSETRCDVARDSGYTRADISSSAYTCILFARGCCPQGSDCPYLHRLPRLDGEDVLTAHGATRDQGKDIFGRERTGDYRDDMGGVGSMQRVNRTLYIGKIHEEEEDLRKVSQGGGINAGGPQWRDGGRTVRGGKSVGQARRENHTGSSSGISQSNGSGHVSATERVLRRHFSEWGPLERVRVLHHRGCAFVTYVSEASAQFAKEAMSNQSLDHGEILNVRWSTEDPNPAAQKRHRIEMETQGQKRITERLTDEQLEVLEARARLEAGADQEAVEDTGNSKRQRIEGGNVAQEIDEEEMARLIEENQRNWEEMQRDRMGSAVVREGGNATKVDHGSTQQQTTSAANDAKGGLLSSEVVNGLAYLKDVRVRQNGAAPPPKGSETKPATGLGGLAAYDSDSDADDDDNDS